MTNCNTPRQDVLYSFTVHVVVVCYSLAYFVTVHRVEMLQFVILCYSTPGCGVLQFVTLCYSTPGWGVTACHTLLQYTWLRFYSLSYFVRVHLVEMLQFVIRCYSTHGWDVTVCHTLLVYTWLWCVTGWHIWLQHKWLWSTSTQGIPGTAEGLQTSNAMTQSYSACVYSFKHVLEEVMGKYYLVHWQ